MRDSEIVASIVAGDPRGLAAAYDRYADPLYKYCRTLLRDPAVAADAVQDTFVIAASMLHWLRAPEQLRAWLYAAARNECQRTGDERQGAPALSEALGHSPDFSEDARADLRLLFDAVMNGLNSGEHEVIELQLCAGLAASELADVLGVSPDHAHTLLTRAREQLEVSLSVLLVSRSGRDRCAELRTMLTGWDGRLTAPLRKRLQRHIGHCARCTSTRSYQLRRSLPSLSMGAALTTGAALSFRAAAAPPKSLRERTLALAAGHDPAGAAHRVAVLGRVGEFTRAGFPKQADDAMSAGRHGAGLAMRHAAGGLKTVLRKTAVHSSVRGQAAVTTAGVVAVTAAVAAFSLTGNNQRFTPTADPKVPATFGPPLSFLPPTTRAPVPPRTAALAPGKPSPAPSKTAPARTSAPPQVLSAPPPVQPSTPPPAKRSAPPKVRKSAPPTHSAPPTPAPPPTPRPSPTPTPTPTGTLSASPGGGTLTVEPGGAAQITLSASGGPVSWSVTVANDPDGAVGVFPASGTLTPGNPTATVTVTVSQYLDCGDGSGGDCPTITVSPGGTGYTIWTGHRRHFHKRHHRHSNPAPASAIASITTLTYLTESRRTTINVTRS